MLLQCFSPRPRQPLPTAAKEPRPLPQPACSDKTDSGLDLKTRPLIVWLYPADNRKPLPGFSREETSSLGRLTLAVAPQMGWIGNYFCFCPRADAVQDSGALVPPGGSQPQLQAVYGMLPGAFPKPNLHIKRSRVMLLCYRKSELFIWTGPIRTKHQGWAGTDSRSGGASVPSFGTG